MDTYRILVTEADDNKFQAIQEAFHKHNEGHFVVNVTDGKSLLQHLSGKIRYNHQLPDMLLLNAESSDVDGREALELINANPVFRTIPLLLYRLGDDLSIEISRARAETIESWTYASINAELFVAELLTFLAERASGRLPDQQ